MNRFLLLARRSPDLGLALVALAVVALLVVPVPPAALDLLLAGNLALSATVLVAALLARDALRLASLPTVLLLTTLLRLALEVSSTRLVLSRGDAGRVVEAFGRVVVGGNYVVGAVVFAIVTLVQLLVVTRGAERVAEVAARFALDALPGKQMSVDADLRSGAIDQAEARRRRRDLEREGQLHGAMDGALKFVKGDAVAGVAIVVVNLAGGLVSGLVHGMSLQSAARRYALLAIGDGLAAQVPALLVSVAAGVAVTRVAGEEDGGGLAGEVGAELFGDPRVLGAVAALCGALALLPGLPAGPFLGFAGLAALAARWTRRVRAAPIGGASPAAALAAGAAGAAAAGSPLVLELAGDLAEDGGASPPSERLAAVRRALEEELGLPVPPVAIRTAPLPAGAWRLLLDDVPAATGRAPAAEVVALVAPGELEAVGIPARGERDPVSGAASAVVAREHAGRAAALAPVRPPWERVSAAVAAALRANAHLLLGVQDVQLLLDSAEATHPALVREVVRQVPVPVLAEVLRQLLEERVALRPLRTILEAILEAGGGARGAVALAEACRRALRRHIAYAHAGGGTLEALLLDPAADAALREALVGSVVALDPRSTRNLVEEVARELAAHASARPPVLLASPEVRRAARLLLAPRFPDLAVLSYEELPPTTPVRPIGKVSVAA